MNTEDNIEMREQPFGDMKQVPPSNNKMKVIIGIVITIVVLIIIIIILAFVGKKILLKPAVHWRNPRLPTWQTPLHYDISFKIDPTQNNYFGSSTINLLITNITTDFIVLNAENLQITSHALRLVDSKEAFATDKETPYQNGDSLVVDKVNDYILVRSDLLKKGKSVDNVKYVQLQLKWTANFQTTNEGIFKSTYLDEKGNSIPFVSTYFYPIGARTAFPCFDEPHLITTYTLTINTTSTQGTVLSNMPFDRNDASNGNKRVIFQKTPKLATYDFSFFVSNFPSVTRKVGKVTLNVFVPPKMTSYADSVANSSSTILTQYISYFQYNYTFPKLDIVAVPKFTEIAISTPGLVFIRSRDVMNDVNSTTRNLQDTQLLIAHELCHQWFGPVVRIDWWNDVWLFDGLCNFLQYQTVDELFPDWDIWERFELERASALLIDSLNNTQSLEPADGEIETEQEILESLNDLTSYKGAQVISMSHDRLEAVDRGTFQAGIAKFISLYADKFVNGAKFISALEQSSLFTVSEFLSNWIYKPGYPFVYFEKVPNSKFVARQAKFYLQNPAPSPQSWWISLLVQYKLKGSAPYRYKFNQTETSPSFAESMDASPYLVVNPQRIGYYRVLYTPDILSNMTLLLMSGGVDSYEPEDLIGFFDDMLQMSRTNVTGYSYPIRHIFDFSLLVTGSKNPNFWEYIIEMFKDLDVLLNDPPSTSQFEKFVKYIATPVYTYVGLTPRQTDTHHDKILRSIVLPFAVSYNVSGCVVPALDLFRKFMTGSIQLTPDVQVGIFTAATMFGTTQDFSWLKNRYLSTDSEDEAHRILQALSRIENSELLTEVLGMMTDKSISSADIVEFASLLATHNTKETWDYFRINWKVISNLYPDKNTTILIEIAENFANNDLSNSLNNFINTNRITLTRSLKQCLEIVNSNVKWYNNRLSEVNAYLNSWKSPTKQIGSNIFFN